MDRRSRHQRLFRPRQPRLADALSAAADWRSQSTADCPALAQGRGDGGRRTTRQRRGNAPRRIGLTRAQQYLPALCAGHLVREAVCRHLHRPGVSGALCGRLRGLFHPRSGRTAFSNRTGRAIGAIRAGNRTEQDQTAVFWWPGRAAMCPAGLGQAHDVQFSGFHALCWA